MTTLKQRFALLKELKPGITKADIARATGAKPPSVGAWFSGDTKSMQASTATKVAALYGVSAHWIATGEGEMQLVTPIPQTGDGRDISSNVLHVASDKKVPRLSWHEIIPFVERMFIPPEDRYQIVASRSVPSNSFLVEVEGDALISSSPAESIHPMSLLMCEPGAKVASGDIVIAKHPRTRAPIARRLTIEGGIWYLAALNSAYPMIETTPDDVIARANEVITHRAL